MKVTDGQVGSPGNFLINKYELLTGSLPTLIELRVRHFSDFPLSQICLSHSESSVPQVESHAFSTFDLSSTNIPAFSFVSHSELSGSSEEPPVPLEVSEKMAVEDGTPSPTPKCPSEAAMKVQKVYRSYRTRRMLADSAVVAEELWWQAIDFARLNHSTISFFDFLKPESAASRWNRISVNASKVGQGLSKDAKAQKLAFQHWIEAIDPRHRYGHSLHLYYEEWCKTDAGQPFFFWLDLGDGKDLDVKECPRSKLRKQCIKYLGPQERAHYEFRVENGKILHSVTDRPLDTQHGSSESKWIFVMSTSKQLYIGKKKKGLFHHSSFLAGGATLAAGRLTATDGVLKCISAYSGHYKPTDDCLDTFMSFLKDNGVNLNEVEIKKPNEDYDAGDVVSRVSSISETTESNIPNEEEKDVSLESTEPAATKPATKNEYKRTLSGGLQSPKADVPKKAILNRINSKKTAKSYQLGNQLSIKWSTGAGPRIGCVGDYPVELRLQALELTNLSPRICPLLLNPRRAGGGLSPSPHFHSPPSHFLSPSPPFHSPSACLLSPSACLLSPSAGLSNFVNEDIARS